MVRFLLLCSQTGLRSAGKNNPIKICFSRNQQTDREEAAGKVLGTATVLFMTAFVINSGAITSRHGTTSLTDVQLWNWKVFNTYIVRGFGERRNGSPSSE